METQKRRFPPVTRTDLVRYAGASGDFHPLHHDEQFCREAGFRSPFAMGMYSAGLMGAWVTDVVDPSRIRRFRIRFEQQVWPGDELVVSGARAPDTDTIEIVCTRGDGTVVSRAWVRVEDDFSEEVRWPRH
ncbi:MAG TPA: MaoC/PaaZ C-terminal domain-containing protein [Pseudonocardia sp.]